MKAVERRNARVIVILGSAIAVGLLTGWILSRQCGKAAHGNLPEPVVRRLTAASAQRAAITQSGKQRTPKTVSTGNPAPDWVNPRVQNPPPGQYGKGAHWSDVQAQVMEFFGNDHGRYLSDKYVYHSEDPSLVDQYTASTYDQFATEYKETDFAYDRRLADGTRMLVKQYDTDSMTRIFLFLSADQSEVLAAGMTTVTGTGYQVQLFEKQDMGLTPEIQGALKQYLSHYESLPIDLHVLR